MTDELIFEDRVAQITSASGVLTVFALTADVDNFKPFSILTVGDKFDCLVKNINPLTGESQQQCRQLCR